jgi:GH25 family lysozyme M1 (1,4-beta-N-acetylmuramidase)
MELKKVILRLMVAAAIAIYASPATALIDGIDISSHQGNITAAGWQQIKAAGIDFAFARVSLGSCCDFDANYVNNFSRAIAAGIPIGPYAVGYPHTNTADPNDAVNEANYLVSLMKPYYQGSGLMLRPVLDIELPLDRNLSQSFMSQWVVKWATTVKAGLGVDPIIYTYTSFAATELNSSVTPYPLWIANYNSTPPSLPPASAYLPWSSWEFWQYSSTGSVPGISGNVDLDVFDGTLLELLQQHSPNYSNGDYNNDGMVDAGDYVYWRDRVGMVVNMGTGADGDLSGVVDMGDYDVWKSNFGTLVPNVPAGAGGQSVIGVPEPSTTILFAAAITALTSRRRRCVA